MRRFGSVPLLANLLGCALMTMDERARAGDYGQPTIIDEVRYFDLATVEAAHGLSFTIEQITDAAAGRAARYLTLRETEAA